VIALEGGTKGVLARPAASPGSMGGTSAIPYVSHLPVLPVLDVAGVVAGDGDHRLDAVGAAQRAGQGGWHVQAQHGKSFGQALAQRGGGGVGAVEFFGEGLEPASAARAESAW
jgi:hypothetical protein